MSLRFSTSFLMMILFGFQAGVLTAAEKIRVTLVDEAREIFPDTFPDRPVHRLAEEVARNTIAGVQVLIAGLQGTESIAFSVSGPDGRSPAGSRWYRMIDVPVAENTGLDRNTEKYSNKINPYVIRRAPFRVYDPFIETNSPMPAKESSVALRLELPISPDAAVGANIYRIRITCDKAKTELQYVVTVHAAKVPKLSQSTIRYINWHSLDNICTSHQVEKWSEPFWSMLDYYAALMAKGRQNAFWFIWGEYFSFDSTGHVVEFRRDRLERLIRLFLDKGVTTIHGAPMVGRRDWLGSLDMLLSARAADGNEVYAMSDKGQRMLKQMAARVIAMMKENQWEGQWVQGLFDEPTEEYVDRYKQLIALLRGLYPDIRILEATLTTSVSGDVNIWCPQVQEYQANRDFFDSRKKAGDQVWVYTCLAPGGPWLNRLLDQERLRQVYIGWACAKFDLQGFLHWGLNHHTAKPFEELVRYHMEGQYLPAGDSHIIYPVADGPLSSHRFEAHRIGFEDFELLNLVRKHDPAQADKIIEQVVKGFDHYSTDVAIYRQAKKMLLEAADRATQR